MSKILGLDLGDNSIGWAIVDDGKLINCGTRIFPAMPANLSRNNVRTFKRTRRRIINRFILSLKRLLANEHPSVSQTKDMPAAQKYLIAIAGFSALLAVTGNWQFWINIAFTAIIAFLSITKK
ncbi:hypothetical protein [Chitinophaga alhagiae]|uniref:hypothetical protein n=1 Tax=Chitinophaga alhagiae TaxID=2203219 RepID=UPI000E5B3B88|nr:hypothetical protein [Chitinophaga alhagiae]